MKAFCWHGTGDVRIDTVPDLKIKDPRDAIGKITSSRVKLARLPTLTRPPATRRTAALRWF